MGGFRPGALGCHPPTVLPAPKGPLLRGLFTEARSWKTCLVYNNVGTEAWPDARALIQRLQGAVALNT